MRRARRDRLQTTAHWRANAKAISTAKRTCAHQTAINVCKPPDASEQPSKVPKVAPIVRM